MDGTPDIYPGNGSGRAGSGTGDGTGTACDYALYDVFSAVSFANASSSEGGKAAVLPEGHTEGSLYICAGGSGAVYYERCADHVYQDRGTIGDDRYCGKFLLYYGGKSLLYAGIRDRFGGNYADRTKCRSRQT